MDNAKRTTHNAQRKIATKNEQGAAVNYIRDLSNYLADGNLSDLTLIFGDKKWFIHKALVCSHSKWFHKAVTTGLQETETGVITLKDEPEFADAIDCMVSYFYKATYDVSEYKTSESLLHAEVATLADKYDCASLCELAKGSFAQTIKTVEIEDWLAIADLIYERMSSGQPVHTEFRKLVIASVVDRSTVLDKILKDENIIKGLRSDAELATDLLLARHSQLTIEDNRQYYTFCSYCRSKNGPYDSSYMKDNHNPTIEGYCSSCRMFTLSLYTKVTHF